jgi:hypothetical protein
MALIGWPQLNETVHVVLETDRKVLAEAGQQLRADWRVLEKCGLLRTRTFY